MPQTDTQGPSPMKIMGMMGAYQQTRALKAALELDLFTRVAAGHATAAELARAAGASERGVEILADYLVVAGLFGKSGARYTLAEDAALFLDRRSPASLADTMEWWGTEAATAAGIDLTAAVRHGGAPQVIHDPAIWVVFARAMAPLMRMPAQFIAEHCAGAPAKVLDIAGGHGLYGIAVAQRNPKAEVTLVDAAPVGEVARQNAAAAGVAGRYRVLGGSAVPGSAGEVTFGAGYDLALVTNFLHHFSEATNVRILEKARAALAAGGRLLVLDFVPNPDRVSPPFPAAFSLTMLGDTAEGRAYTEAEFRRMFAAAGLRGFERRDLPGMPMTAMVGAA